MEGAGHRLVPDLRGFQRQLYRHQDRLCLQSGVRPGGAGVDAVPAPEGPFRGHPGPDRSAAGAGGADYGLLPVFRPEGVQGKYLRPPG